MMEEIPQEPIAADPIEDDETDDEAEDSDDAGVGQPVELEDERRSPGSSRCRHPLREPTRDGGGAV